MCIICYVISNVFTDNLDDYCSNPGDQWAHLYMHLLAAIDLLAEEYITVSGLKVLFSL